VAVSAFVSENHPNGAKSWADTGHKAL
jgi:hypothetical protein